MKAITRFIAERGFLLMLCGFATAVVGAGAYAFFNNSGYRMFYLNTPFPGIALTVAFLGVAVYFTGRISLAIQRRRAQYKTRDKDEDL